MNSDTNDQGEVKYKSAEISKKPTPKYFTNIKQQHPLKNFFISIPKRIKAFFSFLFKGKRKLITISIFVVLAASITCLVLWLTLWRSYDPDPQDPITAWQQQIVDVSFEAQRILESNSDSAFFDALHLFDELIASTEDHDESFDLRIARAIFLNNNDGTILVLADLLSIDASTLTDQQKFSLFSSIRYTYRVLGDTTAAAEYQAKINALPPSITEGINL